MSDNTERGVRPLAISASTAAIRVLGPHERGRFAPEAWGWLLSLSRSGLLDPGELELVIDRAMAHIEGRITLADLRLILGETTPGTGTAPAPDAITVH